MESTPPFLGMDHPVEALFGIGACLGVVLLLFVPLFGSQFCRYGYPRPGPGWKQGWLGASGCVIACLGLSMVASAPLVSSPDRAPAWMPAFMLAGNMLALAGLVMLGGAAVFGLQALRQPAPPEEPPFLRMVVPVLPPVLLGLFVLLYLLFDVH